MKTEKDLESALERSTPEVSEALRQRILLLHEKTQPKSPETPKATIPFPRYLWFSLAACLVLSLFSLLLLQTREQPRVASEENKTEQTKKLPSPGRGHALGDNGQLIRVVRRRSHRKESQTETAALSVF